MVLHPNDDEALFSLVAPYGGLLLRASVVAVIAYVFKVVFVVHVVFVFVFAANDDTTPTAATLVVRRVAVVKVVVIMLAKVLVVLLRLNKKNLLLFCSVLCNNSFGVRRFTTCMYE